MAGNKRGVVDWTEAPDPTMRHNGAPTMVLHMKEDREWRERGAQRPGEGVVGVRNAILYRTREVTHPLAVALSSPNLFISIYPSVPLPPWIPSRFLLLPP